MAEILLTTLNARYAHCSLGLRALMANMGELESRTALREFTISDTIPEIAEKILALQPRIVGIGIYVWNAVQSEQLIGLLKRVAPELMVVAGGPEVSYADLRLDLTPADHIVRGEGEIAFAALCRRLLAGEAAERIIEAGKIDLAAVQSPYRCYSDSDIRQRTLYVEASRGCPFACEFCLSSLDRELRDGQLQQFLCDMEQLWQRGARAFKFIDRTFNLKVATSTAILDFFLGKDEPCFLHFEVIPDHFPAELRQRIARFPAASLQLEIGVQTLNSEVAGRIRRRVRQEKMWDNLAFLESTHAHLHLDLIVGLPGESLASFGAGLNRLVAASRAEIQIGILKNLPGTTLSRHDGEWGMVYAAEAPYEILCNDLIPFAEMQRMKRFARYWDLFYNSGNFSRTVRLLWPDGEVYGRFGAFCDWFYSACGTTWQIALDKQAELLFRYLLEQQGLDGETVAELLVADLLAGKCRRLPPFLAGYRAFAPGLQGEATAGGGANKRQKRHAG